MPDWLVQALLVAFGVVVQVTVLVVTLRLVRPARRLLVRWWRGDDAFDMGVRALDGVVPGVERRWRHGIAVVEEDGSISWQGRLGAFPALSLTGEARRPSARDRLFVSGVLLHRARTGDGAEVELAVARDDTHRLEPLRRT